MSGERAGEDALTFLESVEQQLSELTSEAQEADWVHQTYITPDTEAIATRARSRLTQATVEAAKSAARLSRSSLPPEANRRLELLRLALTVVGPAEPGLTEELNRLVSTMLGLYGKGRAALPGRAESLDLQALGRLMAKSRDPTELQAAWVGWHEIGRSIRPSFVRYVELANRGARELGFRDTGEMWQSKYDMPPSSFVAEVERLWQQVRPLYRKLHAYVRAGLRVAYPTTSIPERGLLPAHLLGNMWGQSWENIGPLVGPPGFATEDKLTAILEQRGISSLEMVRIAERFFVSLGLAPLPPTFWQRSMFLKPRDREVVCHASAWDIDQAEDLRIKMCIDPTGEDFRTIHHELGHNYYQRAYRRLPYLFRDSAHDGFHEALGDTIGLSVTPSYLEKIGLGDGAAPASDLPYLFLSALEHVAFVPFGYSIDLWRWRVFSGEVGPDEYNDAWWALRARYQGIAPPVPRGIAEFDPGAKMHVSGSVPYMRYFLAFILQFQFHRALARAAGWDGPIHRASIYGSTEAGRRLEAMMALGQSRPWPEALKELTGETRMDAGALLEYYRPLSDWLDEQVRDLPVGWD